MTNGRVPEEGRIGTQKKILKKDERSQESLENKGPHSENMLKTNWFLSAKMAKRIAKSSQKTTSCAAWKPNSRVERRSQEGAYKRGATWTCQPITETPLRWRARLGPTKSDILCGYGGPE
jgi:hypothetical protein